MTRWSSSHCSCILRGRGLVENINYSCHTSRNETDECFSWITIFSSSQILLKVQTSLLIINVNHPNSFYRVSLSLFRHCIWWPIACYYVVINIQRASEFNHSMINYTHQRPSQASVHSTTHYYHRNADNKLQMREDKEWDALREEAAVYVHPAIHEFKIEATPVSPFSFRIFRVYIGASALPF